MLMENEPVLLDSKVVCVPQCFEATMHAHHRLSQQFAPVTQKGTSVEINKIECKELDEGTFTDAEILWGYKYRHYIFFTKMALLV
jgi:hypothetical protein